LNRPSNAHRPETEPPHPSGTPSERNRPVSAEWGFCPQCLSGRTTRNASDPRIAVHDYLRYAEACSRSGTPVRGENRLPNDEYIHLTAEFVRQQIFGCGGPPQASRSSRRQQKDKPWNIFSASNAFANSEFTCGDLALCLRVSPQLSRSPKRTFQE
jgi:hypothetical protein